MSSTQTLGSVPAVRYRDTARGSQIRIDRELLVVGTFFAALVVAGTALFFAIAPRIADLAALYGSTT